MVRRDEGSLTTIARLNERCTARQRRVFSLACRASERMNESDHIGAAMNDPTSLIHSTPRASQGATVYTVIEGLWLSALVEQPVS